MYGFFHLLYKRKQLTGLEELDAGIELGFSSRGSKSWTLSSHWDTTWAKIWLGLSLVLVARSFMAFLVFEYQTFFIFMDGTHLNSYTPSGFHSKM
jgi:hypothetical protein